MNEPSVLTRMRLSCCWGDNLNEKELNEVVNYINNLQQENQQLKEKINQYENPDDLTLFYMWLDEKAKDKMKQLKIEKEQLNSLVNSCQQEIRKLKSTLEEIREYINSNCDFNGTALYDKWVAGKAILQIIDKSMEVKDE